MKNYISINGNKTELSDEQLINLGFSTATPADVSVIKELSELIQSGKAREKYNVNDIISVCGYELTIIGFDHDRDAKNPDKHTITVMAEALLPGRAYHSSGKCERGWVDSEIRLYLNNDYINKIPVELLKHIVYVKKETHNYKGDKVVTVDKLFIPSESELFGSAIFSDYEDGARYEAFDNSDNRVRFDENDDCAWYWTRSARGGVSTPFCFVFSLGHASLIIASTATGRVPLCFTIA